MRKSPGNVLPGLSQLFPYRNGRIVGALLKGATPRSRVARGQSPSDRSDRSPGYGRTPPRIAIVAAFTPSRKLHASLNSMAPALAKAHGPFTETRKMSWRTSG